MQIRTPSTRNESAAAAVHSDRIGRQGWTRAQVEALFELPFNDLLHRAQSVHRQHHDANAVQLSEREANHSAATTFRTMRSDQAGTPSKLTTIYGVSPLVESKVGGTLAIERIDAKEAPLSVPLRNDILVRGKFYDLAKAGKALTPGGTYLAVLGARRFTFQVDARASSSTTPIVGRLLRLD